MTDEMNGNPTDTGTIHPRDYGSAGEGNSTQHHPERHPERQHLEAHRQEVFDAAVNLDYVATHTEHLTHEIEAKARLHSAVTNYYETVDLMIGRTEGRTT